MKALLKNHHLLIFILVLSFIKGVFWIGLVPQLQAPDAERHLSTIMWYAEPTVKDWLVTKRDIPYDMQDIATYNIPPEYEQFMRVTEFEAARFNPNNHQIFAENSTKGPDEKTIRNSSLSPHFTKTPATIIDYPPLYYKIGAWVYSLFKNSDLMARIAAIQIYSLILSLAVLYFAYRIALRLSFSKIGAALFAGIISFQPMFSFIGASINPDILLILGITMFVYFSISVLQTAWNRYNIAGLASAALVSLYAKPPGIAIIPFLIILILLKFSQKDGAFSFGRFAKLSSIITLIAVAMTYPAVLLIKKLWPPLGNILTFSTKFDSLSAALSAYSKQHFALTEQYEIFGSYWGWFGWLDYPFHKYVFLMLFIVATLGMALFFISLFIRKQWDLKDEKVTLWFLIITTSLFHILILYNEFAYFKDSKLLYGLQGRYFLPMIVPYFIMLLRGYQWPLSKLNFDRILRYIFVGFVLLNMSALFSVIIPAYYL